MNIHYQAQKLARPYRIIFAFTDVDRRTIMATCGDKAAILYEHWLRIASFKDPIDIDDDEASAAYLGCSVNVAMRTRRKLYNNGWAYSENATFPSGARIRKVILGKRQVLAHLGEASVHHKAPAPLAAPGADA